MNKLLNPLKNLRYHSIIGFNLYYFLLITLIIGLPLSPFLTSVAQIGLALNWILEGKFKGKWQTIKTNKTLWFFFIIPIIHVLWLVNTSDFNYALNDLKIKIPLLALPLIIATSEQLSSKQISKIFWLFTWALFSSSLISTSIYLGLFHAEYADIRNISIFISHIRFSLMLVFSLVFLVWNYMRNSHQMNLKWKVISFGLFLWFIIFLTILRAMTGWVILVILFYAFLWIYKGQINKLIIKRITILSAFLIPLALFLFVRVVYLDYSTIKPNQFTDLPSHTSHGSKYKHDTIKTTTDRGYYRNIFVCMKELEEGWNEISDLPFNSKDQYGFSNKTKIARYLSSLGLPKDLDGVRQLDKQDIALIENGYGSSIYKISFGPYIKVYESIYELDSYLKTGNANGKSISMRIEFVKTGLAVIKHNFWFGVGTGDVNNSFKQAYNELDSRLSERNRHRAHNQYLTFFIAFGVFGFIICLLGLIGPLLSTPNKTILLIAFALILFTSMINEDTLETQAGVTFYVLFYSILVFNNNKLTS